MSDEKDEAAPMIELTDLTKVYGHGDGRTVVLDRINFRVDAGEILEVVGPRGAGKSTLAQCINLLTPPTSGSVVVNGEDLTTLSARSCEWPAGGSAPCSSRPDCWNDVSPPRTSPC